MSISPLLPFARRLRREMTDAERLVWRFLRGRRFSGHKFRRQEPVGPFIVDFLCVEKRLVIECDGGQHGEENQRDRERDAWLEAQGFRVLRFWNHDILQRTPEVLQSIHDVLTDAQV